MAQYRALAKLYVAQRPGDEPRLINTGEYFNSDDVPGARWEPVDDDAKEAVAANPPRRGAGRIRPVRPLPGASAEGEEETPRRGRRGAAKRGRKTGTAAKRGRLTPGRSVHRQQTDGEEPTTEK